ncbi:MAG TPA: hypothetical protein VKA15_02510 [Isosphaeraceae bacterium]|nr:hypothetical protein [Isosphaeraceae bacterium]
MYEIAASEEFLSQGDVIDDCLLITIRIWPPDPGTDVRSETWTIRVVVLTQACDLAQDKTTRVVVAPVHEAAELVARDTLRAGVIRDQVRRGQVFGWYFLPAAPAPINLAESIVDTRELHTIERHTLEYLVRAGKRVCRIRTPWREHLAQHFGTTYMRIALPEPYATQP